jgi:anion-transporting  ArsA/GET3 family ATPase
VSTIIGGQMLNDAAAFVQAFETMFGSFRERSKATYELLRRPSTAFIVISAPEPDALREAAYFVDRLSTENMPLVGLVLNRTHPTLCELSPALARDSAGKLDTAGDAELAAAVLRVHADQAVTAEREVRLLTRFTHAHPRVPLVGVPALPFEVADLEALRALGDELTGTE